MIHIPLFHINARPYSLGAVLRPVKGSINYQLSINKIGSG